MSEEREDLDESIADLVYAVSELTKIKDILQDSSTYSKPLPKRNRSAIQDVDLACTLIKRKLKMAQKLRKVKYGDRKENQN